MLCAGTGVRRGDEAEGPVEWYVETGDIENTTPGNMTVRRSGCGWSWNRATGWDKPAQGQAPTGA